MLYLKDKNPEALIYINHQRIQNQNKLDGIVGNTSRKS